MATISTPLPGRLDTGWRRWFTRRRIAVAAKYASDFGIAAECGFGRRPPETIPNLLRVHSEV